MPNRIRKIEADWQQLYEVQKLTAKELASQFHTTPQIIRRHLAEAGIENIRGRGGRNEAWAFSHRHEAAIRELHEAGLPGLQIARKLGLTYHSVYWRMCQMGLPRPHPSAPVNHAFFDVIDSEEKAYWLGFLLADGSTHKIGNKNRAVRLELAARDGDHVRKFQTAVGSKSPVSENKRKHPSVSLAFTSERIGTILAAAKTEMTLPANVPGDLLRHWLRGYWDGDGHICAQGAVLCGPEQRLHAIADHIRSVLKIEPNTIKPYVNSPTTYRLAYQRRHLVLLVVSYLYEGASVELQRKAQVASDLLDGQRMQGAFNFTAPRQRQQGP